MRSHTDGLASRESVALIEPQALRRAKRAMDRGAISLIARSQVVGYTRHMPAVLQTEVFEEWLDGLRDRKAIAAVRNRILRIEGGLFGDVRSLGDRVSEARIDYGPGYRLYFTMQGLVAVILLSAVIKGRRAGM